MKLVVSCDFSNLEKGDVILHDSDATGLILLRGFQDAGWRWSDGKMPLNYIEEMFGGFIILDKDRKLFCHEMSNLRILRSGRFKRVFYAWNLLNDVGQMEVRFGLVPLISSGIASEPLKFISPEWVFDLVIESFGEPVLIASEGDVKIYAERRVLNNADGVGFYVTVNDLRITRPSSVILSRSKCAIIAYYTYLYFLNSHVSRPKLYESISFDFSALKSGNYVNIIGVPWKIISRTLAEAGYIWADGDSLLGTFVPSDAVKHLWVYDNKIHCAEPNGISNPVIHSFSDFVIDMEVS